MTNDKHDPEVAGTEPAAGQAPHSALPDNKGTNPSIGATTCCSGMSCRKKIILGAIAALAFLAIILACSRWCRKCRCRNEE